MGTAVLEQQANPGAKGVGLDSFYFNLAGLPCYVGNDGVEYVIAYRPVKGELPAGTMNSSNRTFTLAHTPVAGIALYLNGMRLGTTGQTAVGYTLSGLTITMTNSAPYIPAAGDDLVADYEY